MSPNSQQGPRCKECVSVPSPKGVIPAPENTDSTHCTLKMNSQMSWCPAGVERGQVSKLLSPLAQLRFLKAMGTILTSHFCSSLYMEERVTEIALPFKVIWTKLVAESDNVFPGTLQPSLVVRDDGSKPIPSHYPTHPRAGELLFWQGPWALWLGLNQERWLTTWTGLSRCPVPLRLVKSHPLPLAVQRGLEWWDKPLLGVTLQEDLERHLVLWSH